jgi:uncharacterized protein
VGDTVLGATTLLLEFAAIFFTVSLMVQLLLASGVALRLQAAMRARPGGSLGLALLLGAVTPFCSCSTVPLVAGMVAAGVPVAAMTAFLIVSPLVNPATVALLAALVSPAHALGFVVLSLALAVAVAAVVRVSGVRPLAAVAGGPTVAIEAGPGRGRLAAAARRAWGDLRAVAPALAAVAVLGALLQGRVDAGVVGRAIDAAGPWAVPVAVLLGVPVYASTAVLLPLGTLLLASGAQLGVVTAFLIGATGLSLPEGLLLWRLVGARYLAVLTTAFVIATIAIGYAVQAWWSAGAG